MRETITVSVHGCVRKMGELRLPDGSSVADAIKGAGGTGSQGFGPTGIVTVRNRRKRDGLGYVRRVLNTNKLDPRKVALRDRDFLVVQFDVTEKKGANQTPQTTPVSAPR